MVGVKKFTDLYTISNWFNKATTYPRFMFIKFTAKLLDSVAFETTNSTF